MYVPRLVTAHDTAVLAMADIIQSGGVGSRPFFDGSIDHFRALGGFAEFASAHLSVQDRKTRQLVPLQLNWIQRQVVDAELAAVARRRRPWFLVLKYRRGGVTTVLQGLNYWKTWADQHVVTRTFAHRKEDTESIFTMVSRFYDHQPPEYRHPKTPAGVREIKYPPPWDSVYMAETAGAKGAGRGGSVDRLHLSEAAHYPDLAGLHEALRDSVAEGGAYHMETTPNGKDGKGADFYEAWQWATRPESTSPFIPLFFPWHADPANAAELLAPDELGDLSPLELEMQRRYDLAPEQLKWHRAKREDAVAVGRNEQSVLQENPNDPKTCFLESGASYFDEALISRAREFQRDPIVVEENGRLRIFEMPQCDTRYVLGADPAEGVGRDESGIVCFNLKTGETAFTWAWDRMPPAAFGRKLAELGRRWTSPGSHVPGYIVVERNNHGHAVLIGLLQLAEYPRSAVYHETEETADRKRPSGRAGWLNKPHQLTMALGRILREETPKLRDERVIDSIRRVGGAPNGGAEFGGRDLAVAAGVAAIGLPHATQRDIFI